MKHGAAHMDSCFAEEMVSEQAQARSTAEHEVARTGTKCAKKQESQLRVSRQWDQDKCTEAEHEVEEALVEEVGRPEQGLVAGELACEAPRLDACDQLPEQGLVFQWVAEAPHEQEEALEGHDLGASHTPEGPGDNPEEEEDRRVAAEDRDREPRVVGEEAAGRKLHTVAVEVHPAVSRRYGLGRRPAIAPRRA